MKFQKSLVSAAVGMALMGVAGAASALSVTSYKIEDVGKWVDTSAATGCQLGFDGSATDTKSGMFKFSSIFTGTCAIGAGQSDWTGDRNGGAIEVGAANHPVVSATSTPGAVATYVDPASFTNGFIFAGTAFVPYLKAGASIDISGGMTPTVTASLPGFGGTYNIGDGLGGAGPGFDFALAPDSGTLKTFAIYVNPTTYKLAMTWSHVITTAEDPSGTYVGFKAQWVTEGTATVVPVPAAVWLFGSGLVGLAGIARRKKKA